MSIPILVNENKRWKAKKLSDVNGSGFLVDLTYTVHQHQVAHRSIISLRIMLTIYHYLSLKVVRIPQYMLLKGIALLASMHRIKMNDDYLFNSLVYMSEIMFSLEWFDKINHLQKREILQLPNLPLTNSRRGRRGMEGNLTRVRRWKQVVVVVWLEQCPCFSELCG